MVLDAPSRRAMVAMCLGALALLSGCGGAIQPSSATATPAVEAGGASTAALRWVAFGDSYSAGFGGSRSLVSNSSGPSCPQAEADSYARRATELLPTRAIELHVAACGGALSGDLVQQLGAAGPAGQTDVATVTVGGNDIGFMELIRQCSNGSCPDLAASDADLAHVRRGSDNKADWDVLVDLLAGRFGEILRWLRPGGTLLVLTYPLPFPEQSGPCPTGVGLNRGEDAAVVNAAIVRLDDSVVEAVARVAGSSRDRTAVVVEWRTPEGSPPVSNRPGADGSARRVSWNPAGICGLDPMLNGLWLDAEIADSFHPSDRGLDLAAAAVAAIIERRPQR